MGRVGEVSLAGETWGGAYMRSEFWKLRSTRLPPASDSNQELPEKAILPAGGDRRHSRAEVHNPGLQLRRHSIKSKCLLCAFCRREEMKPTRTGL